MKTIFFGVLVFLGAAAYCAAAGIAEQAREGNEKAEMSYAFGMVIATEFFLGSGIELNYGAFLRGFRDVMENRQTHHTIDQAMDMIEAAFMSAHFEMAERNLAEGTAFLEENAQRPGVLTTPSGLQIEVLVEGTGDMPDISDVVLVHYHGTTIDGTVFDSTVERGEPMELPLEWVIPGWSEGLRMMREGGKAILFIPPELAYGSEGAGAIIGPNTTVIFEVELIEIVRSE